MFGTQINGAQGMTLLDFPAPAGQVVGAAFDDALETNPIPLAMQSFELNGAKARGPRLPRQQALDQAKREGVNVTVPDDGMSSDALGILIERRKDQAARDLLFARSPGGVATAGQFAAGFAGALMDPLNVALGFIPVLGGTRYAGMLAEAGTAASRGAIRVGVGAAEGAVGAVATELPTLGLRRDLQDDYSLYDSLANIAFGTMASAGIRGVSGAARDAWTGIGKARQLDALRSVEPEVWERMRADAATAQERQFWGDLERGFQRGEGIPEGMAEGFRRDRFELESADASGEFQGLMGEAMDQRAAAHARIAQAADEAIARRYQREYEKRVSNEVDETTARREAFQAVYPEAEAALLKTQAEVGRERLSQIALDDARQRIAEGRGSVVVPRTDAEALTMIQDTTHAQALKTAVAQAIEGRQIDVDPILRRDPAFGNQRMPLEVVRSRARTNMAPESRVSADRAASERATAQLEEKSKPPKAKPRKGEAEREEVKSPEMQEAEALLADAREALDEAVSAWRPQAGERMKAGALSKESSGDAALVARAIIKDASKVEALGVQFSDDDAAFMKAVKELLGADADAKTDKGGVADRGQKGRGGEGAQDPEVARAEDYANAYEALARCAGRADL